MTGLCDRVNANKRLHVKKKKNYLELSHTVSQSETLSEYSVYSLIFIVIHFLSKNVLNIPYMQNIGSGADGSVG